ncbi:MAG: hypothetical protein J3K34DRAFT_65080 [Monoraphidium minutum]|nr:MAG: hypothetical protein J3K34DRAFT_65080 [Monoraphidium minutum]
MSVFSIILSSSPPLSSLSPPSSLHSYIVKGRRVVPRFTKVTTQIAAPPGWRRPRAPRAAHGWVQAPVTSFYPVGYMRRRRPRGRRWQAAPRRSGQYNQSRGAALYQMEAPAGGRAKGAAGPHGHPWCGSRGAGRRPTRVSRGSHAPLAVGWAGWGGRAQCFPRRQPSPTPSPAQRPPTKLAACTSKSNQTKRRPPGARPPAPPPHKRLRGAARRAPLARGPGGAAGAAGPAAARPGPRVARLRGRRLQP